MNLSPALASGEIPIQSEETKFVPAFPRLPSPQSPHLLRAHRQWHVDGENFSAFKKLLWRRFPHISALAVALVTSEFLTAYPLIAESSVGLICLYFLFLFANDALMLSVVVAALTAAQVWISHRVRRVVAMVLAVAATALATSALRTATDLPALFGDTGSFSWEVSNADRLGLFLYFLWMSVVFGGLLAILYESQMRFEQINAALLKTWLDGESVERSTLESRLNVLKARVEPEFLFDVITRVESLYQVDAAAAERLIEELIDFLRTSLPRAAMDKSTLDHELQLCASYVAIERMLRDADLTVQLKAESTVVGGYFPPAVLLPLLQRLLPARDLTAPPVHLLIAAERRLATIHIELTSHANTSPLSEESLETAGRTLRTFFGTSASVSAKPAPFGGQTIAIAVPYVGA